MSEAIYNHGTHEFNIQPINETGEEYISEENITVKPLFDDHSTQINAQPLKKSSRISLVVLKDKYWQIIIGSIVAAVTIFGGMFGILVPYLEPLSSNNQKLMAKFDTQEKTLDKQGDKLDKLREEATANSTKTEHFQTLMKKDLSSLRDQAKGTSEKVIKMEEDLSILRDQVGETKEDIKGIMEKVEKYEVDFECEASLDEKKLMEANSKPDRVHYKFPVTIKWKILKRDNEVYNVPGYIEAHYYENTGKTRQYKLLPRIPLPPENKDNDVIIRMPSNGIGIKLRIIVGGSPSGEYRFGKLSK